MMKFWAIISIGILACFCACKNTDTDVDSIPSVPVRIDVTLTNNDALPLNIFPNYIYLKGGYKGVILFKDITTGEYIAYDRCCSYRPLDTCARVSVTNNLYLFDPCCKSQFDFEGNYKGGPAFRPLRYYTVSYLNSNQIRISN